MHLRSKLNQPLAIEKIKQKARNFIVNRGRRAPLKLELCVVGVMGTAAQG